MMLKLRGHPPVLMKKDDGEKDGQISTHLSKVENTYQWLLGNGPPTQVHKMLLAVYGICQEVARQGDTNQLHPVTALFQEKKGLPCVGFQTHNILLSRRALYQPS